ncbi:mCG147555 [Mus musculus]|nr:mCG147555 [Mus musculus]
MSAKLLSFKWLTAMWKMDSIFINMNDGQPQKISSEFTEPVLGYFLALELHSWTRKIYIVVTMP